MAAPPSRLDRATSATALDALLRWVQSQQKHKKAQLLEHDEPIQVLISLRKIPAKPHINPHLIPLPHPLTHSSICLLVDDRPYSKPIPLDAIESKIKSDCLPISKVISLQSLRTDYVPFESRRKLCGSYDLFFADRRILPLLPRLLGKQFFKKKKLPLKIDLSHENWLPQIQRGCGAACLYIRTGTCCHLNVGSVSMGKEDILENLSAAVEGAVQYVPKGWGNVRAVYLKLEESVSLPIYQALPDIGMKIEVLSKDSEGVERVEGKEAEGKEVGEKNKKNTKSKKGTISEVRYMDRNLDHETIGDSGEESEDDVEEDAVVEVKVIDAKKKRKNEGLEDEGDRVVSKKSNKKKKKTTEEDKGVGEDVVEAEGMGGKRKRNDGKDAEEIVSDADGEGVVKKTKKEKITKVGGKNKKTKKKKGTISEVRYMDRNLDHETIGDSGVESEGDVEEDAIVDVKVMDVKKKKNEGLEDEGKKVMSKKSKKKKKTIKEDNGVAEDVAEAEGMDGKQKMNDGKDAEEIVRDADVEGVGKKTKNKSKKEKIKRENNGVEDLKGSVGIGDHGGKNMVNITRKKKKEVADVKEDEAAVEAVDVLDVARVGVVERKNKSKSVDRSTEQKKGKKKKSNS